MDIKAVVKNARTKGIRETWSIHKKRKHFAHDEVKRLKSDLSTLRNRVQKLEKERLSLQEQLSLQEKRRLQKQVLRLFNMDLPMSSDQYDVWIKNKAIELEEQSLCLLSRFNSSEDVFQELNETLCLYFQLMDCGQISVKADAHVQSFLNKLSEMESKQFVAALRSRYVKELIPETYQRYSEIPVDGKKAVFLQPRKGLNQAFGYMYRYLKAHGYSVQLFELGRGSVPQSLYYWNALSFAKNAATAKVVFVHESNELLGHTTIRPDSKVVQLWHGCGVFKKIGLDTAGLPGFKSKKGYEEYPEYNYFSCVTIASPDQSWVFERFMGIPKETGIIKPLGVSRTDIFFDEGYREKCYEKLYKRIPAARNKRVILYAPTYRGVGQNRIAPDALDIRAMSEQLSSDYILIIKHHQTAKDLPALPDDLNDTFVFDMTRGKGMDINELMTVSDICVSDYSSLVCEFSLFERPMAFFVYDLEDYIDDRGLYYDFDEITPGPLCKTTDELIDYISNINERFDKQKVIDFKNKFMSSCDGHATERIVSYIEGFDKADDSEGA